MSTMSPASSLDQVPAPPSALRARIRWVCHLLRIAVVLWAGWLLLNIILGWYWSNPGKMMENLGRALNADLSGVSNAQVTSYHAIALCLWLFIAATAYCVWRLCGTFLQDRVFTVDAAVWMRRAGIIGLVSVLIGIVWRRAALFILTGHAHLPAATLLLFGQPVNSADLLRAVFSLFLLVLGHIFKTAAEIADDQARIV